MTDERDIVVIGGGIHGVGVAQAAAAAGYTCRLLERGGLADGTSSKSSKLIHGGLRYLEGGHVGLVRECLRERELLLRLAPGLVRRARFYFPLYRSTRRRPWQLRLGLLAYRLLAGRRGRDPASGRVPRSEWDGLDGLRTDGLQAVYRYTDAQTDDAALTRAVMRSAESLGAELAAPARFVAGRIDGAGEYACTVDYEEGGGARSCRARVVVNAAGPWANEVLAGVAPAVTPRSVALVQGAHIVVRGALTRGVYYVENPDDRRAVFVMPWGDDTLVGTTETPFDGHPDEVRPLDGEKQYLLETLGHYFPRYDVAGPGAIASAFAGLRVLPVGDGRVSRRSRETILDVTPTDRPRMLTIYGGKLTAYRATAARVIDRLRRTLPPRRPVADTTELPLTEPS